MYYNLSRSTNAALGKYYIIALGILLNKHKPPSDYCNFIVQLIS